MVPNEDRRDILIKILYYQNGYGARKLTKKFPAKTWKKIGLNFQTD